MSANLRLWVEERSASAPNRIDQPVEEFTRLREAYFESMPLSGDEQQNTGDMRATVTHVLRCVHFVGANPRMRLTAGRADKPEEPERVFNVISVIDVEEKRRHLEWKVCEVV